MGEVAEMMLDGTLCQECGGVIDGTTPGYPRTCEDCLHPLDFPWAMKLIREMINDIEEYGSKKEKTKLKNYLHKRIRQLSCRLHKENKDETI